MSEYAVQSFRNELIEWSQPLIIDQINRFYFSSMQHDASAARDLAIQHYRVWRLILREEVEDAAELRDQLVRAAVAAGLRPSLLDDVDRTVLDELMDVVVSRFRRTPHIARSYGMTLLDTATCLARARHSAA